MKTSKKNPKNIIKEVNQPKNKYAIKIPKKVRTGFAVAAIGMVVSIIIFTLFKKYYADADYQSKNVENNEKDVVLTKEQERYLASWELGT